MAVTNIPYGEQSYDAGFQWPSSDPTPVPTPLPPLYPQQPTESISVGYPVTEPTALAPGAVEGAVTPTPPTTPTPSPVPSDSGIPPVDMSFYPGWNDQNAIDADWANTWQQKTGATTPSPEDLYREQYPNTDIGSFDLSAPEHYQEIESQYGARMDYLNKAEQAIRAGQPDILAGIAADMKAAQAKASTAKGKELGVLKGSATEATRRKEDALASARRLYNELRMGGRQRFGGASSAGEAMNTLLGIEQQRQMGQTRRGWGQTMQEISRRKADIENQYQDQLLQLEANDKNAKNQANQEFRARLDEINNNRLLASDAKIQARLGVLQDLRDKNFQIQAQNQQFRQQLEANRQQQQMDLDTYAQKLQMSSGYGQAATTSYLGNTTVTPTSSLTATGKPSMSPADFNASVLQGATSSIDDKYKNIFGQY